MAIIILPDAQEDLLSLQDYMLDKWGESAWIIAEDEIFEKLRLIETGFVDGSPIPELAAVGITIYKNAYTSHHQLVYQRLDGKTYLYLAAGHRQDYTNILLKRLLRR
ncbi:MAG: plasmid stabilization system protein [Thiomonas sp. 20-64-9]|jgi:plasmid stabilization system protein ParE|uniref:Type II toxin-antitoxin system RelE/ParE family toxin n=1 Tax=Thiomonas arsenitoxydans (strain DSM 22701 / CIP 110005 / 3As) TaxID=426114 RepID=A0A8I1MVF3_THIA3|nr:MULTISPECIES: type II toxin-antitoxin system RelE/ParE family toxin [Thiomonas]MBN8743590.1 type II toxin-antitoxin system RelE/ParE family toxin [Thiomonas arsenitoxydans]ODU98133.1 MAG: plasmid stabilization system protein [Thiomonas sp. SCN 64-16]OYV30851.1 MAG: plasmid stabilization system protein [Thiomonas sp. 20-64-9]OZB70853.1 MAG: plasmid stabilization system protein [Thiomonas sp. 13-64-67]